MQRFGLIGNPISHSKSPALFKAAYGEGKYSYTLIEAESCAKAMERFTNEGFTGINITSPFKDEVMNYVHTPDDISSTLGSANTIVYREGKLYSYNTDFYGVANTLQDVLSNNCLQHNCNSLQRFCEKQSGDLKVLAVGAGGAGKAAALAVKQMGMEVYFANRSSSAAKPFAEKIGAEYLSLAQIPDILPEIDIILYNLSVSIDELKGGDFSGKIVFEANYAHPNLNCSNAGVYVDGRFWLYNQAIPAFKLFTREEPNTLAMRDIMSI